jgi:hypothetical protein
MKNKVKFLKSLLGVDDGKIYPTQYNEGEVHEIGSDLTALLLTDGAIELVIEEKAFDAAEDATEEKAFDAAPENKAFTKAPENKRKAKK